MHACVGVCMVGVCVCVWRGCARREVCTLCLCVCVWRPCVCVVCKCVWRVDRGVHAVCGVQAVFVCVWCVCEEGIHARLKYVCVCGVCVCHGVCVCVCVVCVLGCARV